MMVALEPVVPVVVGEPLWPPVLQLPVPLLLVVPALQAFEELVELGVLALLDADPGALLLPPLPLLLDPMAIPPPGPPLPGVGAEVVLADEGTPVVVASGRQVSTWTGSRGETLNEHRT